MGGSRDEGRHLDLLGPRPRRRGPGGHRRGARRQGSCCISHSFLISHHIALISFTFQGFQTIELKVVGPSVLTLGNRSKKFFICFPMCSTSFYILLDTFF